jgi:hypothetical protein
VVVSVGVDLVADVTGVLATTEAVASAGVGEAGRPVLVGLGIGVSVATGVIVAVGARLGVAVGVGV